MNHQHGSDGRFVSSDEHRTYCVEEVQFLRSCAVSDDEITHRMGMTPGALSKALRRAGRGDLARPFENMHARMKRKGQCVDCGAERSRQRSDSQRCVACGHKARVAKVHGRAA